jgi:hypothetical protein
MPAGGLEALRQVGLTSQQTHQWPWSRMLPRSLATPLPGSFETAITLWLINSGRHHGSGKRALCSVPHGAGGAGALCIALSEAA